MTVSAIVIKYNNGELVILHIGRQYVAHIRTHTHDNTFWAREKSAEPRKQGRQKGPLTHSGVHTMDKVLCTREVDSGL